jgi:hypothetical protein
VRRFAVRVYELLLPPLMPLPPKPPELPELPTLLPPLLELDDPTLPRLPADVDPALRLAVLDEPLGADETLLPAEDALTAPATEADLLVAAPTRAVASDADLLVAATPPPVPEAWPDTAPRAACNAVLREAACDEATVEGLVPLDAGGGEYSTPPDGRLGDAGGLLMMTVEPR